MNKLLTSLLMGGIAVTGIAKNPVPMDPAVRVDTLDNGLTYYLRNNTTPSSQVDFFIVQRVGSVNEEDNQRGLAHFLEHMCFNGTEHFPGNSLISYLESLGVKFGANLNAYTSTDETVYNICGVPSKRVSSLDSCLLILRDWSCGLLLTEKDIDAERGVIKGEWRQRNGNPANRMLQKAAPEIYPASRYGEKMPIGLMEIIETFPYNDLRDYYHKWYRPENQAIIVVGDIDLDKTEMKIKDMFGSIPRSEISSKSPAYPVPSNRNIIASVQSDPEQQQGMIQIHIKHPSLAEEEKQTIDGFREGYIRTVIASMMAERFDELENDPNAPFSNLGTGDTKFILSREPRSWVVRASVKPGREQDAVKLFSEELRRAARHGFLATELERGKLEYKSELDSRFLNRHKIENKDLAKRYVRHFLENEPFPEEETYYKIMKGVMSQVTLTEINRWFNDIFHEDGADTVIIAYLPSSEAGLTPQSLIDAYNSVAGNMIERYEDNSPVTPLMTSLPEEGEIISESFLPQFQTKVWTLSNGIKVYSRQNKEHPDQILVYGTSPGGISMEYNEDIAPECRMINDVMAVSAFGGHTSSELRKRTVGRKADVKTEIDNMEEQISVSTTPEDLETALQVLYLKATAPLRDDKAFETLTGNKRIKLERQTSNPAFEMGDSIHANVYDHHPLGLKLSLSDIEKVDYDRIIELYRNRFADMSDFSFFITGNFNEDSLRNLTKRYLASLPGNGVKEKPRDIGYRYASGKRREIYGRSMETPVSITYSLYTGDTDYDLKSVLQSHILGEILASKLLRDIREERGWTYSVRSHIGINPAMNGDDVPKYLMPVYIRVEPGHEEECLEIVSRTIENMKVPGFITEEETAKVRNHILKNAASNADDNSYWVSVIRAFDKFGLDMHSDYSSIVGSTTADDLTHLASQLFANPNCLQLVMKPI